MALDSFTEGVICMVADGIIGSGEGVNVLILARRVGPGGIKELHPDAKTQIKIIQIFIFIILSLRMDLDLE